MRFNLFGKKLKDPMTSEMEEFIEQMFWELDHKLKSNSGYSSRDIIKGFFRRIIRKSHGYTVE